jgi:hypothetical protein
MYAGTDYEEWAQAELPGERSVNMDLGLNSYRHPVENVFARLN